MSVKLLQPRLVSLHFLQNELLPQNLLSSMAVTPYSQLTKANELIEQVIILCNFTPTSRPIGKVVSIKQNGKTLFFFFLFCGSPTLIFKSAPPPPRTPNAPDAGPKKTRARGNLSVDRA